MRCATDHVMALFRQHGENTRTSECVLIHWQLQMLVSCSGVAYFAVHVLQLASVNVLQCTVYSSNGWNARA